MFRIDPLKRKQKMLEEQYRFYRLGIITEAEYIKRAKPLDKAISELEMLALPGTPALKRSS